MKRREFITFLGGARSKSLAKFLISAGFSGMKRSPIGMK